MMKVYKIIYNTHERAVDKEFFEKEIKACKSLGVDYVVSTVGKLKRLWVKG